MKYSIFSLIFLLIASCGKDSINESFCPAVTIESSYRSDASLYIRGDFNNWQLGETPMKLTKTTGAWSVSLDLETGKEYQFRYLIDGTTWENDPEADKFVPSGLGSENSVLAL